MTSSLNNSDGQTTARLHTPLHYTRPFRQIALLVLFGVNSDEKVGCFITQPLYLSHLLRYPVKNRGGFDPRGLKKLTSMLVRVGEIGGGTP